MNKDPKKEYQLYLIEWYATHDEGDPACYEEWLDWEWREQQEGE